MRNRLKDLETYGINYTIDGAGGYFRVVKNIDNRQYT